MSDSIITPPFFSHPGLRAFFTTKIMQACPRTIAKTLRIRPEAVYMPVQKHTDKIHIVDADLEPKIADAVVTKRKDILIGIQVADCTPILLFDTKKHVIGAVHAGWRGTAEEILKKTVQTMMDRFYSLPTDIVVAIGPAIRWGCYGVGHEVIEAVSRVTGAGDYMIEKGGKYCLDLPAVNKCQAVSSGVPVENIWVSDECTFCLPGKYFSYRYAKGTTGRQGGFIGFV